MGTDCDRELIEKIAENILRQRLNGENPNNDSSPWDIRASNGCDVFRDAVRNALDALAMGHVTVQDVLNTLEICKQGISSFLSLDATPWRN